MAGQERDEESLAGALRALEARVARIEAQLRQEQAATFRDFALEIYRHVDRVALRQRANFDRELAALRQALGQEGAPPRTERRPGRVHLPFGEAIAGYGVLEVQRTSTGKLFRHVRPRCGFLVPAVVAGPAQLVVQGIRRSHDGALEDARLAVNGQPVPVTPYLNPRGESWNITVTVPAAALRSDSNLVELALPNGPAPGARGAAAGIAVGILEVTLTAAAALPAGDD